MKKKIEIVEEIAPDFHLNDLMQVIIGATILAIPVGFSSEVWKISETIPIQNVAAIIGLSLMFLGIFTYYHYHNKLSVTKHWNVLVKRTLFTYIVSFLVVFVILTLIQKVSIFDLAIGLKRTVLITLPSSMSATIADTLK